MTSLPRRAAQGSATVLVLVVSLLGAVLMAPSSGAATGGSAASAARAADAAAGTTGTTSEERRAQLRFTSPKGANDWSCQPTAARPTPVVLVHGTFLDRRTLFDRLSLRLVREGYCVYALDYGQRATQRVQASARELSRFVDRVLASTGAAKVSLVGHSQGAMMPRHYIKFLGGADKVDDLVGLTPSNYGTRTFQLLAPVLRPFCESCRQQEQGSDFLRRLNRGDDSPGSVSYTNVVTRFDAIVTPHTNGYLRRARNVTNLRIQDLCPARPVGHISVLVDRVAIDVAVDALGRTGPADPRIRPRCL